MFSEKIIRKLGISKTRFSRQVFNIRRIGLSKETKQNCEVVYIRLHCINNSCLHYKSIPLINMHIPRYADAAQPKIFLEVFQKIYSLVKCNF